MKSLIASSKEFYQEYAGYAAQMQYVKKKKNGIAESRYFSCYTALQFFSVGEDV